MPSSPTDLAPGQHVTVRGQRWTVLRSTSFDDCATLGLSGSDRWNSALTRTFLLPFDTIDPHGRKRPIVEARRRRWCRHLRYLLQQQQPFAGLDALIRSQLELHAYQLEPALALLRHGHLRILIADAVGLGKTIQAGAALAQLAHEDPAVRGLIVCPAGLRVQWQAELADRFGLAASICEPDWLTTSSRDLPPGVNPWSLPGVFIASMDLVKRPEVLRDLEDLTWDVVVFDEAHALSPGTSRLAAARTIAARSRRVLMLTATPPDSDPEHIAALRTLGQGPGGDPLVVFQRSRADVGFASDRRSVILPVRLSADERILHRLLEAYTEAVWREAGARGDSSGRLLSILLRKRALSSAGSLAASVARRLALLTTEEVDEGAAQVLLPLWDDDIHDDAPPDTIVGAPGLADGAHERRLLAEIHAVAVRAADAESKIRLLRRFLRRANQPAIVFTEYRDTLARLAEALDEHPLQLHGGMLPQERDEVQARFVRDGGLLLATDAASEGLNLHQRCRLVVHFELPWNPMRLEQRIGRVDRLGQQRRVHEVLLVARHTAERLVLAPLVRRIRAAQASRTDAFLSRLSESEVAAAVLEGIPLEPPRPGTGAVQTLSLRTEADGEARRLRTLRESGRPALARRDEVIPFLRQDDGRSLIIIARATGTTAGGRQLGSMLVPVRLDLDSAYAARPTEADVPELAARCGSLVEPVVRKHLSPWDGWPALLSALMRRELEIRSCIDVSAGRPVQAGLFDRRERAAAEARNEAAAAWHERADAHLAVLERERDVDVRVEIVAICAASLGRK